MSMKKINLIFVLGQMFLFVLGIVVGSGFLVMANNNNDEMKRSEILDKFFDLNVKLEPEETSKLLKKLHKELEVNPKLAGDSHLTEELVEQWITSTHYGGFVKCPNSHMLAISQLASSTAYEKSPSLAAFANNRFGKCRLMMRSVLIGNVYLLPSQASERMQLILNKLIEKSFLTHGDLLINNNEFSGDVLAYSIEVMDKVYGINNLDVYAESLFLFLKEWSSRRLKEIWVDNDKDWLHSRYAKHIIDLCETIEDKLHIQAVIWEPFLEKGMLAENDNYVRFWHLSNHICTKIIAHEDELWRKILINYAQID